ncbi:26s proteasome regulatory complex component [Vairimorpha ceranae]|uniref:26s proteasome regulatory complex component n=1 Tax=Vairimorpha ceranae TaxID=40302 RepID=A0A0F9WIJ8_9MICR|nr:26s proteasome regulatory complex component [Vairimorpha ceranae]KAF5140127.1 hypothetical protein G9O61_00g016810 [Vairimorpha ceranae]KKO76385.1 26s proteasome regulatory complex component [Vairimorpha ceranae]
MNESLYEKERLARKEGDLNALKSIFMEMLQTCNTDQEIISLIKILAVRRGQLPESIRWLVNEIFTSKKDDNKFIKMLLSEVIEGKIYLERERVEYTLYLMSRASSPEEALSFILDVPVETFTLIDDTTIIRYQLEQLRLCLEVQDWIKANIILKRIRQRYFEENNAIEERLNFYTYKIRLLLGQGNFLEASKTYLNLNKYYEKKEYAVLASFFCIIAEEKDYDTMRILLNDKYNDKNMRIILDQFLDNLLIKKDIIEDLKQILTNFLNIEIFMLKIHDAINYHNFKIIEKFYSIINISTFTDLMEMNEEDLINKISFMVNTQQSKCKINQREKTVTFENKKMIKNVDNLMDKLITVDHLIHKETLNK